MVRFNTAFNGNNKTVNLAGGKAYRQTPQMELVSILLTSFANDQFYRIAEDGFLHLKEVIAQCDPLFAAKAAVYARTQFGMRSITHVAAAELAKTASGAVWAKDFYAAIVHRPDDMMEILAYHYAQGSKATNAMKKGFAKAFDKFDAYQLGKYRGESKDFSLVDIANLVHPVPTARNSEALKALINGSLRAADTWEAALTDAGQKAKDDDEKAALKSEAWTSLIRSRKIGYFALLRNLRNIILQAPEVLDDALAMLTDEKLIRNSLVLPFRYLTAYDELMKLQDTAGVPKALTALSRAVDISVRNVPQFDGDTLVVLDTSGSMAGRPAQIGSLFSAILVKSNYADLVVFSDYAQYRNLNPTDSVLTLAGSIRYSNGGTNFHAIFNRLERKYDRIVILSDMQGWVGYDTPQKAYADYRRRSGANPYVYSFDLNSYGNMQFPQDKVYCLAGFSEKVFDIMKLLETDRNAMIQEIEKVSF